MKTASLIFLAAGLVITGCNRSNDRMNEPAGAPVNGSYGDAGRKQGVPADSNNGDTNLLTTPDNPLHRVVK